MNTRHASSWPWITMALFITLSSDAHAHGPGRKMKAETKPCQEQPIDNKGVLTLTTTPWGGNLPYCITVINKEPRSITLIADMVDGELMTNGTAVCLTGQQTNLAPLTAFHPPQGSPQATLELTIPAGETIRITGSVHWPQAGHGNLPPPYGCIRVRLAPTQEDEQNNHAGHVKHALHLQPLRITPAPRRSRCKC